MTNIKTVTNTAFGKTLHYVVDNYYADAIKSLTGKRLLMIKILLH